MTPRLVLLLCWGLLIARTVPAQTTPPAPSGGSNAPAPLVVTRFWHPWRSLDWPYEFFMFNMLASDDDGVWLEGFNPGGPFSLFQVGLPGYKTQVIPLPEHRHTQMLAVSPDALYMAWDTHGRDHTTPGGEHQIARYDRKTAQWAAHDLPPYSRAFLYPLDRALYLFLQNDGASAGDSAVARYDWDRDQLTLLASTRRRPGQNQFDDRANLLDGRIFLGPGHRLCFNSSREGTFYIRDDPGPWPSAFDDQSPSMSSTSLGKTLVFGRTGEVTLLDPDRATSETLLAPTGDGRGVWDLPASGKVPYDQVCLHEDTLFVLNKPREKGGPYELLCYQRGRGRGARSIPLEFRLDDASRSRLSVEPAHAPATWNFQQIEHPDTTVHPGNFVWFRAVRQGLYIQSSNVGFWLLPYEEIAAYLEATPN